MKNLAEQITKLQEREKALHKALDEAKLKECNSLLKRLKWEGDYTYEQIFDAYLACEYPMDKDGNNLPYRQPSSLSPLQIVYLYVQKLPYIKAKRDAWYKVWQQLKQAKEALK